MTQSNRVGCLPIDDVAALARRYCDLIDAAEQVRMRWLSEIAGLLPRLHAAMTSLSTTHPISAHVNLADLDARFELFSHLRILLADRDGYWLEFDHSSEGVDAMTGSLADDLTDIYCELRHGLRVFERDPQGAAAAWLAGYQCHWGQHLIDAERHLALLAAQQRLEPRPESV